MPCFLDQAEEKQAEGDFGHCHAEHGKGLADQFEEYCVGSCLLVVDVEQANTEAIRRRYVNEGSEEDEECLDCIRNKQVYS